jgi:hypothetical protein
MRTPIACLVVLAACSEYNVQPRVDADDAAAPDIEVDPVSLTFGPVPSGQQVDRSFEVRNLGPGALTVDGLELTVGGEAFTLHHTDGFVLETDEAFPIDVSFVPAGEVTFGQVTVFSNDPDTPEATVDLEGLGEVPALQITPDSYLFPGICDDDVVLELRNVGLADLQITAIDYQASPELALTSSLPLPLVLAPGDFRDLSVAYTTGGSTTALGTLTVSSNDPRGDRTAEQMVEGSGDLVTETYTVVDDPPVDILFTIDKSCSMLDEARSLGQAFDQFISEIDSVTDDWQIGVATKDGGCFNNGIITANTYDYESVFVDATSGGVFSAGSLTEALLELTDNALLKTTPGSCNEGFVRGNALLHVITVSDEPEQSGQPWHHWVGRWQARMSDPNLVMVSGVIIGPKGGNCGEPGTGYIEAIQGTGGVMLDVCTSDWGAYAQQLGAASASSLLTYLLSTVPEESTIEVSVDGTTYANGWHYDPVRNAVVIDVQLPAGSEVEITYVSIGC